MRRFALAAISCLCVAAPAYAADLGPYPPEKDTYIAPPPLPRVERKIVEHHHYYHEAPAIYRERRVYLEPRVYRPAYAERVYGRYAFAHLGWRPHHFFPGRHYWGRHRHGW